MTSTRLDSNYYLSVLLTHCNLKDLNFSMDTHLNLFQDFYNEPAFAEPEAAHTAGSTLRFLQTRSDDLMSF